MMLSAKIVMRPIAPPGEHVEHAEDAAALCSKISARRAASTPGTGM